MGKSEQKWIANISTSKKVLEINAYKVNELKKFKRRLFINDFLNLSVLCRGSC